VQLFWRYVTPATFDVVEEIEEDIVVGKELLALLLKDLVLLLVTNDHVGNRVTSALLLGGRQGA